MRMGHSQPFPAALLAAGQPANQRRSQPQQGGAHRPQRDPLAEGELREDDGSPSADHVVTATSIRLRCVSSLSLVRLAWRPLWRWR